MKNREIELYKLGFKKNEQQASFHLNKFGKSGFISFHKIYETDDVFWSNFIEKIKEELKIEERQYYDDLKRHSAYNFAQKQLKQQILDLKNKYKSHLQEETNCKIGKNINFVRETELKAKISTLIELEKKLGL